MKMKEGRNKGGKRGEGGGGEGERVDNDRLA
jgi:hypothetical protein